MRRVSDESGREYVLLKRSGSASLLLDVETETVTYLPNDQLNPLEEPGAGNDRPDSFGETAGGDPDIDPIVGLLLELHGEDAVAIRSLLGRTELCESDLHGILADLRASSLIEQVSVGFERGYGLTEAGEALLDDVDWPS